MPEMDQSRDSTTKLILSLVVDGDYYGGSSAAVPFKWESQPGTPSRLFKRSSCSSGSYSDSDFNPPVSAPLTPPPSYFYTSPSSTKPVNPKKSNTLFGSLLSKNRSTPSSPVSSLSSSSSVPSSPLTTSDLCRRRSRRRSMWFESGSSLEYKNNAKSSGCYASIFKVFLGDVN